jgi:DNA modification methylase
MSHVLLVQADSLAIPLADQSVHCIVTSPPYWGLRDYQTGTWAGGDPACTHSPSETPQRRGLASSTLDGGKATTGHQREGYGKVCAHCGATRDDAQLGRESLHDCLGWATGQSCGECYLDHMRTVFAECWRVLRDDGVLFVNIADSYANDGKWGGATGGKHVQALHGQAIGRTKRKTGLKPKDLCGIPQRLAFALQADGWYWRSEIIWEKPSCMPESVTDRPTRSHEQVLLLTKRPTYFYDGEAIRESYQGSYRATGITVKTQEYANATCDNHRGLSLECYRHGKRNARTVWRIATEATSFAHFATMPTELVRRCILAGTSEYGVCSACGAPWRRRREVVESWRNGIAGNPQQSYAMFSGNRTARVHSRGMSQNTYKDTGWSPTCTCDAPRAAALVFDPFVGSGTTVLVACALGRDGVGTDLSYPYLRNIAQHRIAPTFAQPGLFEPRSNGVVHAGLPQQTTLFGESRDKESA